MKNNPHSCLHGSLIEDVTAELRRKTEALAREAQLAASLLENSRSEKSSLLPYQCKALQICKLSSARIWRTNWFAKRYIEVAHSWLLLFKRHDAS